MNDYIKLKLKWTREMISDLQSFHTVDITKEIEDLLMEEIKKYKRRLREKKLKRIFNK